MNARTIPRAVIENYLNAVRIPIDAVIDRLPGNGTGVGPTVRVMVDRADASLRAVVASVLRDPSLEADANLRAAATYQREQALRLREQADQTAEQADDRLQQREAQAERRRVQAAKKAKELVSRPTATARRRQPGRRGRAQAQAVKPARQGPVDGEDHRARPRGEARGARLKDRRAGVEGAGSDRCRRGSAPE